MKWLACTVRNSIHPDHEGYLELERLILYGIGRGSYK